LVQRLHALLAIAEGMAVRDVAPMLDLGEQTVRASLNCFLWQGVSSGVYKHPPGRPAKLTKTPRHTLAELIQAGPQAVGYTSGGWNTPMRQDLLPRRGGVESQPHYICPWLPNLGFASHKARFGSDPLNEAKRLEWRHTRWPPIVRRARQRKALLLFGAAASVAQWGSRSSPWAPRGQQPAVPTSGKRRAYKVFGLIASVSGRLGYKGHTGRFNSAS
jgi:transposase